MQKAFPNISIHASRLHAVKDLNVESAYTNPDLSEAIYLHVEDLTVNVPKYYLVSRLLAQQSRQVNQKFAERNQSIWRHHRAPLSLTGRQEMGRVNTFVETPI